MSTMQNPSGQSRKRPLFILLAIALALAIAGGGYAYFSGKAPTPGATASTSKGAAATTPRPALTVTVAAPQTLRLPIRLTANGTVAAWQEAVIGAEVNGLRLLEVRANVGDWVQAGQVLAVFSAESVNADVAQAQAGVAEAQANAAEAAANASRARSLEGSGALSTQQINQFTTAEKTAQLRVQAAKAVLGAQQLRGRQAQVRAPDSGIVSARLATVGSVAAPGTELFRLVRRGRIEWRAEVTSAELGRITPGMPVFVRAAGSAESARTPAIEGKVRLVAPTIDAQTRIALVYVDLPSMTPANSTSSGNAVRPGMFAQGEFELGSVDALTVPQQSLVVRDGFSYVYVLDANNRVSQRQVQTGRRAGDRVEVTSGLSPADSRIASSGAGFLAEGDTVRIGVESAPVSALKPAPAQQTPAQAAIK